MSEPTAAESALLPTSPEQLFARLDALGLAYRTVSHPPVFTVEEAKAQRGALPGAHIKNLFLRDKKKVQRLVVALEDRPIDLKALGDLFGARLSFGSPNRLFEALGVRPGSVTPMAAINDAAGAVEVILDAALMEAELINVHPLVNTMTTAIAPSDLIAFLKAAHRAPTVMDLASAG